MGEKKPPRLHFSTPMTFAPQAYGHGAGLGRSRRSQTDGLGVSKGRAGNRSQTALGQGRKGRAAWDQEEWQEDD